jgi:selenocysteine lyase/cysteine desulfurase
VARPAYFAQESFEPGGRYVPRAGAQRFDVGWIAVGALAAWEHSLRLGIDLDEDRFARIAALTEHARKSLAEQVDVVTAPAQSGLVTFVPHDDPAEFVKRAYEQGVVLRDLPGTGWARASCGWWNDERDVERLLAALQP